MCAFRRTETQNLPEVEAAKAQLESASQSNLSLWLSLLMAGIAIAATAESMVHALESLSVLTHIPYVVSGTLAGVIGCLGEMLVIHNYSIHASGRLGDALVGVAMDSFLPCRLAQIFFGSFFSHKQKKELVPGGETPEFSYPHSPTLTTPYI